MPRFLSWRATRDAASIICKALGRGVARSKRRGLQWTRKAAENGDADFCLKLAMCIYKDQPYAREVGHVVKAIGVASSAGLMEGHDVPPDAMSGVLHWLRKGGHDIVDTLDAFRSMVLEGAKYCQREGCEVVGQLKDSQSLPAVQGRPVLRCRVSERGLDDGWAQGKVWRIRLCRIVKLIIRSRSVGRGTCNMASERRWRPSG